MYIYIHTFPSLPCAQLEIQTDGRFLPQQVHNEVVLQED